MFDLNNSKDSILQQFISVIKLIVLTFLGILLFFNLPYLSVKYSVSFIISLRSSNSFFVSFGVIVSSLSIALISCGYLFSPFNLSVLINSIVNLLNASANSFFIPCTW